MLQRRAWPNIHVTACVRAVVDVHWTAQSMRFGSSIEIITWAIFSPKAVKATNFPGNTSIICSMCSRDEPPFAQRRCLQTPVRAGKRQ